MEEHQTGKVGDGERQLVRNKKYAPATGIQSDFEKILTIFVETKSVRYEDFAKIWRERKLSLVCAGRQTDRETVEFMEECMKVAVKMFLPPYGFQARVGALYLLYGLYLTQPCLPKVKIRVTREDWEHVKSLEEEFTRQSHHDTRFILQKLLLDGAFYFCAVSQEARSRYAHVEEASKSMNEALREDRQRIDGLFSEEILEQMNMIHGRYHKQKVRVAGPDASRPDRSLDVLHEKFPISVRDVMVEHHERWKAKESQRQGVRSRTLPTIPESGESEEVDSDPDYQPASTVGQRRARLKAMAYRGIKNRQRYKHRSLATESSSEKGSPTKKKRGRPRGSTNKPKPAIQRPAKDTTTEQEKTSTTTATESGALLSMPHFEEVPAEDKRPGRKRKNKDVSSPAKSSPAKKQKSVDTEKNSGPREDRERQSEAAKSPTKRGRGRPPKLRADVSRPRRPVGRPRKKQSNPSSEITEPNKKGEELKTKKKDPKNKSESGKARNNEAEEGEETVSQDREERDPQPETSAGEDSHTTASKLNPSPSSKAKKTTSAVPASSDPQPSTSGESLQSATKESACEQLAESSRGGGPTLADGEHSLTVKSPQARGKKRAGNVHDGGEGVSKEVKKTGGEGKGAKFKIIPLQASKAGSGKKNP